MAKYSLIITIVFSFLITAVPALGYNVFIPDCNNLPDPDGSTGSTDKPVKVYILSGQSNMVGFGRIADSDPNVLGTLEVVTKTDGKFPYLVDDSGAWTVRQDVYYRGVISAFGDDKLRPGFGANGSHFGPELGFGHIMGYLHDEPVLVIKSSIGNRSLSWDVASPSTPQFEYDGKIYAGYGESPNNWPVGEEPVPIGWYCGYEWDRFFLDEADFSPSAARVGLTSAFNVTDILDNFASEYPQYAAQGFEIAGFGWFQGHKDGGEQGNVVPAGIHAVRYEFNLTNFINDIRDYYEKRYPNNIVRNAPFVVATCGFAGGNWQPGSSAQTIFEGQMAVGDPVQHPEFASTVASVDTRGFWRDSSFSPTATGYHYNHNAETYMLVGDGMGRAMAELQRPYEVNAGKDIVTWNDRSFDLNVTVEDGITVQSYLWEAFPDAGVTVDISDNSIANPTVTITKPAGEMVEVLLRVAVEDGVEDPVYSFLRIYVYDDACKATRQGLGITDRLDLDADCVIDLIDFAIAAGTWLEDGTLDEPVIK